jgi:cellulose synthase/poly-beta-1,6-N-acetylglucosamine synthase-like glycosyltransferase
MPDISLIISVYNRVDALALILSALNTQRFKNFEIVVAEDNNAAMMRDFIAAEKGKYFFTIKHVSQPDNGFQKNKILNEAIKDAEANYLVFIDGDCIPHREFLNEYHKLLHPKICLFGRRMMLSEAFTKKILSTQQLQQLNFINLLLSGSKRLEDGIYLPIDLSFKKRDNGHMGLQFWCFETTYA